MSFLASLYDAHLTIAGHPILAGDPRQRLRVRLGRRRSAPPGLGLAGRHHRQRAAVHGVRRRDLRGRRRRCRCSGRRGGRCSSSSRASTAGTAGTQVREARGGGSDSPAITPRWATAKERVAFLVASAAGVLVLQWVFSVIGAGWPAPAVVLLVRRLDLRRLDAGDVRAWPGAGPTSGWPGSRSTWSACRCCGTRSTTRPPSLYVVYGVLRGRGFFVWPKAVQRDRARARSRRRSQHERARGPDRHRRAGGRRHRGRQGRSSSWTTRTARTRAT